MNSKTSPWQPPPTSLNRHNRSVILYLPYASGGISIRRILNRLIAGQYVLCETDLEAWAGRSTTETYSIQPTGHIYIFFNPGQMKKAILDSGLRLEDMTYLICLRDPRDLLVSLYFLTQDTTHLAFAQNSLVQQQMLMAASSAAATPVDEYVLNTTASFLPLMEDLERVLAEIPAERITHLSYAALCHAFPQYLAALIDLLDVHPARHTIADILETEDIQRPKTLHQDSFARFPKASPSPGRHKRDLKPDTIRRLYQEFRSVLAWMAKNDLPEFRELYT